MWLHSFDSVGYILAYTLVSVFQVKGIHLSFVLSNFSVYYLLFSITRWL